MVLRRFESFLSEGSRWTLRKENMYININKYTPFQERVYVKLLEELTNSMKGLLKIYSNKSK